MDYLELISFFKKNDDKSLLSFNSIMNCAVLPLISNDETSSTSSKKNFGLKNKILLAALLSNGFFVATLEKVNFKSENMSMSYEMSYFAIDLVDSRNSKIAIKEIATKKNVDEFVYIPKNTFVKNNYPMHFIKKSCTVIDTKHLLIEYERLVDIHKLPCSGFGHISMHRFAMK